MFGAQPVKSWPALLQQGIVEDATIISSIKSLIEDKMGTLVFYLCYSLSSRRL